MKIAISAESTIDLPKQLLAKYNIKTIPFMVILGDEEFKDGEISSKEIFAFAEKNKILPKTAAINQEQYREYFATLLKDYDAVIHMALSSEISSACSHAKEVANEMDNVFVVDTKSLSTGIALLAIYASELAEKENISAQEIFEKVSSRVPNVQASFVIKKLDYLYKGGRCSALSYFGANLLQIRPQILLKDGKMGVHKKYHGKMEKVIQKYCIDVLEEFNKPDLKTAFVTYTTASPEMIETAKNALKERGFENIIETTAGATISSHCGENTLGILYINDAK